MSAMVEHPPHPKGHMTPEDRQTPAFRLVGLRKVFGDHAAVERADLTVSSGSFFGLVGPNGAGKTTALSMGVGLLRPDEGRSEVFGVDVWKEPLRARRAMGVLPDGLALSERLTGRELLAYLGALRGLDPRRWPGARTNSSACWI